MCRLGGVRPVANEMSLAAISFAVLGVKLDMLDVFALCGRFAMDSEFMGGIL